MVYPSMRRNDLPELVINSQDPVEFCLRIKHSLAHELDPDLLNSQSISTLRKWMFVSQGWRLTYRGLGLLSKHYRSYLSQNASNELMTGKILLNMDHCVGGPWWASGAKIILFNPISHFELEMVEGNAKTYVDFRKTC